MRMIKGPTLSNVHEQVVKIILEKGYALNTEDDEATMEYDPIAMRVDNPLTEPMVSPCSKFKTRFMDNYANDLIHGTDAEFSYDYHDRLFNWGNGLLHHGKEVHINQIEYIIKKITSNPPSRRGVAVIWNPAIDETLDDCPCLQLVQCAARDRKLHMRVVFRSNDMLTAAGANMYALVNLQKYIAERLNLACGPYTHVSLIPHVYYKRDVDDIEPFCQRGTYIQPDPLVCAICRKC